MISIWNTNTAAVLLQTKPKQDQSTTGMIQSFSVSFLEGLFGLWEVSLGCESGSVMLQKDSLYFYLILDLKPISRGDILNGRMKQEKNEWDLVGSVI